MVFPFFFSNQLFIIRAASIPMFRAGVAIETDIVLAKLDHVVGVEMKMGFEDSNATNRILFILYAAQREAIVMVCVCV